jgi:PleD family two-component response regulator
MPPEKSMILVVDDNPNNRKALLDILKEAGFKTLSAWSGEEALRRIGQAAPDLILLDAIMPGLDGLETCRRLKAAKATQHIPIIFMAGLMDLENKNRGFEVGGDDFVSKPIEHRELIARITTHLTLHHLQKSLETQTAQLQRALNHLQTLSALLPVCAGCRQFRNDAEYEAEVTVYLDTYPEALSPTGVCPACRKTG